MHGLNLADVLQRMLYLYMNFALSYNIRMVHRQLGSYFLPVTGSNWLTVSIILLWSLLLYTCIQLYSKLYQYSVTDKIQLIMCCQLAITTLWIYPSWEFQGRTFCSQKITQIAILQNIPTLTIAICSTYLASYMFNVQKQEQIL